MITAEKLKQALDYDKETGQFTWKVSTGKAAAGEVAGYTMKHGVNRYVQIGIGRKLYLAHRLAWFYVYGSWPQEIDHINGNGIDNRWSNLREVNRTENARNMGLRTTSNSGAVGVSFDRVNNKWRATIRLNYKQVHLGRFATKDEAIAARLSAEQLHGFHENHGKRMAHCR